MLQTHRFTLGKFECIVVNDGDTEYATADFLFNGAPKDMLEEKLKAYNLNPNKIKCCNNCLIVNTGDHLVLIDTGCGPYATKYPGLEKTGNLFNSLKPLNISPEDFDTVILTHVHGDHIWGITTEQGNLTFPGAKHVMFKSDWDFGIQYDITQETLKLVEDHIQLLEGDTEIVQGIKIITAHGHTPGHSIVSIHSEDEEMLFTADMLVHPIHVESPDCTMIHEYDKEQSVQNRRKVLKRASLEKLLIHAFHLAFPGLGHIVPDNEGWKWQPIDLER
jgi:glyoxylase-like metal-dependent hydrolase (beta-lactamase superfamily II)